MSSSTDGGEVIRVSKKGQATIPKKLRERFGIDTPGKVLIHEEEGKIVVEPLPSVEEMQGVHAGRYETGDVLEHLQEMDEEDKHLERERDESLEERHQ
ncbi:AbrB/MazE/SpoVT family DNA-binding domain-containing protein [Halobacterium salinarum]|uniref:AbrB/MazE/SpoVT family DNA-binding domain-containing protein n=1 Tax=Halobacterium TaxID=2239 RepID=UPI00255695F6|nr:AbrB/MazE/SpoVT family DNA-binding domain-containing protein [Halobacterium salinarum]MDL0131451.1 AbrB/MazE/SpoVT family DNA-binding domain-containing protein [Halobacterium salinarum]MDL0145556.1 AbrB/MazE/SpoVT family DNA-binding domain-containing protein [Halobacterium salinarum]